MPGGFNERKYLANFRYVASCFLLHDLHTVHNLSKTSLKCLDDLVSRYLKRWFSVPPSATRAIFHHPQFSAIKTVSHLYKECQSTAYMSSKLKADRKVTTALESRLERESNWTRKSSTIVECESMKEKVIEDSEIPFTKENIIAIKKSTTKTIEHEMNETWKNHLKSLVVQGKFLDIANDLNSDFNYKSLLFEMPRNVLKFLTNAAIDTLPTNSNLTRWNKRNSPKCELCPNKQTLLHVLNNCPIMLDQGRYTWRHNSVLNTIVNRLRNSYEEPDFKIYADLPGLYHGISTVPTNVAVTNLKPDICIVSESSKEFTIIELTIPFETNIQSARERKSKRYATLKEDIENKGYTVSVLPIEIGSRGFISQQNVTDLLSIFKEKSRNSRKFKELLKTLSKIAITASYCVFYSKFENLWINPELIEF